MANYGFGITAPQINKLVGGEWTNDNRILCYMAAAIADLPDVKAYAKFVSLLNTLGIHEAARTKITKEQWVETFAFGGKVEDKLSDDDMRKEIAKTLWETVDPNVSYVMLNGVTGEALTTMFDKQCTSKKDNVKFVLHRIVIGQSTIYRICPDGADVKGIAAEAIRYLNKEKA